MSSEKKPKLKEMKIGTHDGTFHCDEVFACYMLKQLPQYKHANIIRTRDAELLKTCDIVVDVGGEFNPERHRYDHHQKTFTDSMNSLSKGKYSWSTKLSSAGLIYWKFGADVIGNILVEHSGKQEHEPVLVETIYHLVYENFVEAIDAIDNGVNICDETPRYKISTGISSRVGYFNLPWNHPKNNCKITAQEQFEKAMTLVGSEFRERILYYVDVWWPARSIVFKSVQSREKVDDSKEILFLEKGGCPWKEHLYQLESELKLEPSIKYVVYEDANKSWRVQCVPKSKNSFENRLSLPEEWRGLRDEELSKIAGLEGCIFTHASGFIGGHKVREGALEMARRALKQH